VCVALCLFPAIVLAIPVSKVVKCGDPCNTPNADGSMPRCRSKWGSCGDSKDHCNAESQWDRTKCGGSDPKPGPKAAGCVTQHELAKSWVAAVNKLPANSKPKFNGKWTAAKFCEAALAVAHGESYDTPRCPKHLDSKATNAGGVVRGLWQFSSDLYREGMSVEEQAKVVLTKYSTNNQDYGCKASWQRGCTAITLPGTHNSCSNSHVFCTNVWTGQQELNGGHYTKFLVDHSVKEACAEAMKGGSSGGGNAPTPPTPTPPTPTPPPPPPPNTTPAPAASEPTCKNAKLKPFKDTPTAGKCTCGKSWAHASKLGKRGKSACVSPGSRSTAGRKKGKGRKKRG